MITKRKLRLLSTLMACLLFLCSNTVAFATEAKNSPIPDFEIISSSSYNEYAVASTRNTTIKNFQGEYYTSFEVPFTVTDSSRPVRVLYSMRYADGSSVEVSLGLRNASSSVWFWTSLDIPGSSQIKEIGRLQPGNYVLKIIPNRASQYVISGQIYYFG